MTRLPPPPQGGVHRRDKLRILRPAVKRQDSLAPLSLLSPKSCRPLLGAPLFMLRILRPAVSLSPFPGWKTLCLESPFSSL